MWRTAAPLSRSQRSVSHRQKMGILAGVTTQLMMKFVRTQLAEESLAQTTPRISDAEAVVTD